MSHTKVYSTELPDKKEASPYSPQVSK